MASPGRSRWFLLQAFALWYHQESTMSILIGILTAPSFASTDGGCALGRAGLFYFSAVKNRPLADSDALGFMGACCGVYVACTCRFPGLQECRIEVLRMSRRIGLQAVLLLWPNSQRVHVGIWYILRAQRGSHIPTLRAKYAPYSYMDPLGLSLAPHIRSIKSMPRVCAPTALLG